MIGMTKYKLGDIVCIKSIPGSKVEVISIDGSFIYCKPGCNYPFFESEID